MRKRIGWKAAAALACLCGLGVATFFIIKTVRTPSERQKFGNAYKAIQADMTENEVHAILGAYSCQRETHAPMLRHPWEGLSLPHPWGERKLTRPAVVTESYKMPDPHAPEFEGLYIFVYLDEYGNVVGKDMLGIDS